VHVERVEIRIAPALVGRALDRLDQAAHDLGGLIGARQRPTAPARAVGREHGLLRVREKLAVLALGRARGTGRPAEHPGSSHPDVEDALVVRVALGESEVADLFIQRHDDHRPFAATV
jgi:hypothetical protein